MSVTSLKIHFALDQFGSLTTIEDVELNGLKCNCSCIGCGQPLVARLGKINRAHFAHHHVTSNCNYSAETDLHLAAKEYVRAHKRLLAPLGFFEETVSNFPIEFIDVEYETPIRPLKEIPDLIGHTSTGEKVMVEIAVTHFCDSEKIAKYKRLNLTAIEFDFSPLMPWSAELMERISDTFTTKAGNWLSINPVSLVAKRVIDFERKRCLEMALNVKTLESNKLSLEDELSRIMDAIDENRPSAEQLKADYVSRLNEVESQFYSDKADYDGRIQTLKLEYASLSQQNAKLESIAQHSLLARKTELEAEFRAELEESASDILQAYADIRSECEELERIRRHTLNQLNALKAVFPNIGYIKTLLNKAHLERQAIIKLEDKLRLIAQKAGIPWPLSNDITQEIANCISLIDKVDA